MNTLKNNEQNENEKKYKVYAHINKINGKIYIGLTSKSPNQRWDNGKGYVYNSHFWSAIKKYGWDNFEHMIIFDDLTKEMAYVVEKELIKKYNTTDQNFGYNHLSGGDNGYSSYNPNYIRTYSEETRRKMSESQKRRFDRDGRKVKIKRPPKLHSNIHKIYKLDYNFKILESFVTKKELNDYLGKMASLIFPHKPYYINGDFIYVYAELYEEVINDEEFLRYVDFKSSNSFSSSKKVICLNDLKVYKSITQASQDKHVNTSSIIMCCQGKYGYGGIDPVYGKLLWEYYDETKKYIRKKYTDYKKCLCITTNEEFDSAMDAAEKYGLRTQSVHRACRNECSTLGGSTFYNKLEWKYI